MIETEGQRSEDSDDDSFVSRKLRRGRIPLCPSLSVCQTTSKASSTIFEVAHSNLLQNPMEPKSINTKSINRNEGSPNAYKDVLKCSFWGSPIDWGAVSAASPLERQYESFQTADSAMKAGSNGYSGSNDSTLPPTRATDSTLEVDHEPDAVTVDQFLRETTTGSNLPHKLKRIYNLRKQPRDVRPVDLTSENFDPSRSPLPFNRQQYVASPQKREESIDVYTNEFKDEQRKKASEVRRKRRRHHVLFVSGPYSRWKPINTRQDLHNTFTLGNFRDEVMDLNLSSPKLHASTKFLPYDWTQPEITEHNYPKPGRLASSGRQLATTDIRTLAPLEFEPLNVHEQKLRAWQFHKRYVPA
ncbi:hypothetical protein FRC20_002304 [Serendipita sp. 405]|nr:hypothetical protein FRC20_002304 [Serendipita sp. 405]